MAHSGDAMHDNIDSIQVHTIPLGMSQAYLLANDAGMYLVDAGMPSQEGRIFRAMQQLGRDDLRLIFVTHAHLDHYGSAAALRELLGTPIAIHEADADAMARGDTILGDMRRRGRIVGPFLPIAEFLIGPDPTPADVVLADGDSLATYGLDAYVLHTPGHTDGSACLIAEERMAFVGDLLTAGRHPHPQRFYASDWSQIPRSLARLHERRPEWAYAGHGAAPLAGSQLEDWVLP